MRTIVHLSDTHFGAVDEQVREALLRDLHAHPVDLIVVSGDLTQRARSWQFRQVRAFLDALPTVPRLVVPGNHDIPLYDLFTRFLAPYRLYRRFIASELAPSYLDELVAVLCVNATRRTRRKNGVIGSEDVVRTAARLQELAQPFKLVVTHQPLAVTLPRDVPNLARGAERALVSWIAAGADLFLGGHIHLPYCLTVQGAGDTRTAVVFQAGTALSWRIRHGVPNSFNRVMLIHENGERCMRLVRLDYDAATGCFVAQRVLEASDQEGHWQLRDLAAEEAELRR